MSHMIMVCIRFSSTHIANKNTCSMCFPCPRKHLWAGICFVSLPFYASCITLPPPHLLPLATPLLYPTTLPFDHPPTPTTTPYAHYFVNNAPSLMNKL